MQTLFCHTAVGNALSSAKIVWTLFLYRKDGLLPGQRQVGGLQHSCPRKGEQGLCHAELLQDGEVCVSSGTVMEIFR
jgi:hypothetical protein